MLRVRYLLYIGLMIHLLDLYALQSDALNLLGIFGKKKEKDRSKETSEEAFYRKAFHTNSRETKSGEHLQYAYNPYCGWTKIFGGAGLQSNCFIDKIVGPYRIFRKYYLIIDALI